MVRNEDERAQALRDMGAEVVVGNLLDLGSVHTIIAGCETMYFGMSVSNDYCHSFLGRRVRYPIPGSGTPIPKQELK